MNTIRAIITLIWVQHCDFIYCMFHNSTRYKSSWKTMISKFPSQSWMSVVHFWFEIISIGWRTCNNKNKSYTKLSNTLQCRGIMFGNKVRYTIAKGLFLYPYEALIFDETIPQRFFHYIGVKLFMSKFLWVFLFFM